jgi:hypothetical protein
MNAHPNADVHFSCDGESGIVDTCIRAVGHGHDVERLTCPAKPLYLRSEVVRPIHGTLGESDVLSTDRFPGRESGARCAQATAE